MSKTKPSCSIGLTVIKHSTLQQYRFVVRKAIELTNQQNIHMQDNREEEPLENQSNVQLENPSDENIPIEDANTITPNQETENMEVHKHPHHVTHKKKWGRIFVRIFNAF